MSSVPETRESEVDKALRRFECDARDHEMTVLRDEGLYRHLRFQTPGSSFYWFDLITWPGRLVICGDAGDWMFSRTEDMFAFFEHMHGGINPGYWAEKLRGPQRGTDSARTYSEDRFRALVLDWFEYVSEDLSEPDRVALREAIDDQLLGDLVEHNHYEDGARRLLWEFDHNGLYIADTGDWDLCEWDWSYLWCCWAIVKGIERYRAAVEPEGQSYDAGEGRGR